MRLLEFIWIKKCLEGLFISWRHRKNWRYVLTIEKKRKETKRTTETKASTEGRKH